MEEALRRSKVFAMDVDGDADGMGASSLTVTGWRLKNFDVQDGFGIVFAKKLRHQDGDHFSASSQVLLPIRAQDLQIDNDLRWCVS